jgi:hypothetical protein
MTAVIGIISGMLGSRTGRTAAVILLAVMSAALLLWRVFAAGKSSAEVDATRATLDAVRKKVQIDETVARMSPADRRRELARWVRDDAAPQ